MFEIVMLYFFHNFENVRYGLLNLMHWSLKHDPFRRQDSSIHLKAFFCYLIFCKNWIPMSETIAASSLYLASRSQAFRTACRFSPIGIPCLCTRLNPSSSAKPCYYIVALPSLLVALNSSIFSNVMPMLKVHIEFLTTDKSWTHSWPVRDHEAD
jgi:hypothetical protein